MQLRPSPLQSNAFLIMHSAWTCATPSTGHAPKVKYPHGAIGRHGCKDADTAPGNVIDLLVMRYQLRVHHAFLQSHNSSSQLECAHQLLVCWPDAGY